MSSLQARKAGGAAINQDPAPPAFQGLEGLKKNRQKGLNPESLRPVSEPLAHTPPKFYVEDPDLALFVGVRHWLGDEIKSRVIEMVWANPPSEPTKEKMSPMCEVARLT
jgi:hypothetical protein